MRQTRLLMLNISGTTYPHPRDALQLRLRQISDNDGGGFGPAEQHLIMGGVLRLQALRVHVSGDTTAALHPASKMETQELLTSEVE